MEDLVYWRHPTLPGIKVEEISGGNDASERLRREMAYQIWCENGRDDYRDVGHFKSGAPFLYGYQGRISISHASGLLVVATLPATPEVELGEYSDRAALGVDTERSDRTQVIKVASRFLSEQEIAMLGVADADDVKSVEQYVLAWTVKEAVYKAALTEGLDFREQIEILRMPLLGPPTPVYDADEYDSEGIKRDFMQFGLGEAVAICGEERRAFRLFSYRSDDHIVTMAYADNCAKFGKLKL